MNNLFSTICRPNRYLSGSYYKSNDNEIMNKDFFESEYKN